MATKAFNDNHLNRNGPEYVNDYWENKGEKSPKNGQVGKNNSFGFYDIVSPKPSRWRHQIKMSLGRGWGDGGAAENLD